MSDPSRLRASDAEREEAAGDLRDHYAAGRITADELSERLDGVYAAQTGAELAGLRVDLPELHPVRRSDPRRVLARRRLYQDAARHLARREEHAARHAARRDAAVERRRRH
jgi:Domain of unknown function (DUF1707)